MTNFLDDLKNPNRVSVISPDGEIGHVDQNELNLSIQSGYVIAPESSVKKRVQELEYTDLGSQAAAFTLGIARGVSVGLSDLAFTNTGLLTAEEGRLYQEYNPELSIGGEVVGAVGSLLVPGAAAGTVAKGARALTALPRLASKAGKVTELALAGGNASKLGKLGALATGTATEGAIWGAGHAVSRAALEQEEFTAEALMSNMGVGALAGAALPVLGAGASATAKKIFEIDGFKRTIRKAGEKIGDLMDTKIVGDDPLDKLVGVQSVASGVDKETLKKFYWGTKNRSGAQIREIAFAGDEVREELVSKMVDYNDVLETAMHDVGEEAIGKLKTKNISPALANIPNVAATKDKAIHMLSAIKIEVAGMRKSGVGFYGFQSRLKQLDTYLDKNIKLLDENIKKGKPIEDAFVILDDTKRQIGKYRSMRRSVMEMRSEDQATLEAFENMYSKLRLHLEKPEIWGGAAMVQQKVNKAWTAYLSDKGFRNFFLKRVGTQDWRPVFKSNPEGFRRFINGLKTDVKNNLDFQYLSMHNENRIALLKTIRDEYNVNAKQSKKVDQAIKAKSDLDLALRDAVDKVSIQNQMRELTGQGMFGTGVVGAGAIGGVVGGIPGGVMMAGAQAATQPQTVVRLIRGLDELVKKSRVPHDWKKLLKIGEDGKLARTVYRASPEKLESVVNAAADELVELRKIIPKMSLDIKHEGFDEIMNLMNKYIPPGEEHQTLRSWTTAAEPNNDIPTALGLILTLSDDIGKHLNIKAQKQLYDIAKNSKHMGLLATKALGNPLSKRKALIDLLLVGAGGATFGAPGAAIGAGYAFYKHGINTPFLMLDLLTGAYTITKDGLAKATRAHFIARDARTIAPVASYQIFNSFTGENEKTPQKAYKAVWEQLQKARLEQNAIAGLLGNAFSAYPGISNALANKTMVALAHLHEKAPEIVNDPFGYSFEPTSYEIAKFARHLAVVQNPGIVFDLMANGTLGAEEIETLRTVYPAIYADLQAGVMDAMRDQEKMPYAKRLQTSMLLGIPVEPLADPKTIQRLKQAQAEAPKVEEKPATKYKPSKFNMKKVEEFYGTEVNKRQYL